MCIGAQRETGVGVSEVLGEFLDGDALGQKSRSVEVAQRVHAVGATTLIESRANERVMPDALVEEISGVQASVLAGSEQRNGGRRAPGSLQGRVTGVAG